MDSTTVRPRLLSSALLLLALAPLSRAADAGSAKALRTPGSIQALTDDIGTPEDFSRFIEGSRGHQGGPGDPQVLGRRDGRGPGAALSLNKSPSAPRLESPSIPSAAAAPADARRSPPLFQTLARTNLPVRKLAAVLGLGFMLIAASMLETPIESAPEPKPNTAPPAPPPRPRPAPVRPPEPEFAPSRFADALADRTFIDTRMPAPTWRAISWREQKLIEGWSASREKSLGLASLTEWLDAKGGGEGVDVALLKAKLFREA
jgi:hypothetical protein